MARLVHLLALASSLAAVACGPGSNAQPDGGSDASDTDVVAMDTPATDATADAADVTRADAPDYSHAVVIEVRDLTVATATGSVQASHITIRGGDTAAQLAPGRCAFYTDDTAVAPPAVGPATFAGLSAPVACGPLHEFGITENVCVPTTGAPLPLRGSVLATGPLLMGPPTQLKLTLAAMAGAIGPLEVHVVPPAAGVTITSPTTLPARFTDDLTVTWTPLGHTRVLVELELADATGAMMPLTVVCHALTDGSLTIPARMVMPPNPVRLTVTQYIDAAAMDGTGGAAQLLGERGSAIEAM